MLASRVLCVHSFKFSNIDINLISYFLVNNNLFRFSQFIFHKWLAIHFPGYDFIFSKTLLRYMIIETNYFQLKFQKYLGKK